MHPLRAVLPRERTISCFRQIVIISSKCSTNGFSHLWMSMKALVMEPPFETMPSTRFFLRKPSSIAWFTQWMTRELIPCSACMRRVARISPAVIVSSPFSTTAWYTGTVVIGSVVCAIISPRIALISPPIERSLIVSAPNSSAIRAFASSSLTSAFPVEVPRLTLILVRRPLPIPVYRSPAA